MRVDKRMGFEMKLGIMQPYFFPYIGYWQLMNAVDKYVIYDDVNFIKGGWINRNRILNNGEVQYFNIPMIGSSSNKHINKIAVNNNKVLTEKNKKTLWNAYHKASEFETVYPILCEILECGRDCLSEYLEFSIKKICDYLGIDTILYVSSRITKDNNLSGEDKVLDICKRMRADIYYNACGGKKLYHFEKFKENGIKLFFLETHISDYQQLKTTHFVENLSIIDVMMNNNVQKIKRMLDDYALLGGD